METKEIGRRSMLRMMLGLGAAAMGAGVLLAPGQAEAATPVPAAPEPVKAEAMAPESELPASEQTQYYVVRRRRYVAPRRRVVYVRPRRRVYVRRVYRRRYW